MGQYGIIWFTIIFSGLVLTGGPLYFRANPTCGGTAQIVIKNSLRMEDFCHHRRLPVGRGDGLLII